MAAARIAWGIDIGNRALKAVKLVRDGDQVRIDDFEVVEHENVLSNAGDNRDALIQQALANFVQRHPLKGTAVSIGVSGQSSFARFIKLPPVEEKKIPEIVKFEAIQQIPFPLDEVEWAYQLFRPAESPDVEVGIFAMRKELIGSNIKFFTDFDMNVQVVQMNPLAVYNAMHFDGRLDGVTMIVDLGAENTDLIIADNETIWMRSIAIGGNNFTETLVKAFKLPFAKAEDLKRNAQTSKYARQIFQAMRPIFADLVAEIQRSIGFYASVHRDSRINRIIALGGTFRLPGLQKYLQQNLQLNVEKMDTVSAGVPEDAKLAALFNENLLSSVAAYGLALQALGQAKVTSSLLPTAIKREKMWKEKTKYFAAAAALFVVGVGIAFGRLQYEKSRQASGQQSRDNIQRVISSAQALDSAWDSATNAGEPERTRIKHLMALTNFRTVWRDLLGDVFKSLPTPQPQVASGKPDEIKKIKRGDRNIITVDSISSVFYKDMGPILSDPNFERYVNASANPTVPDGGGGGEGGMFEPGFEKGNDPGTGNPTPPPGPAGTPGATAGAGAGAGQTTGLDGAGKRGFIVTLRVTSPNANAPALVESTLLKNLLLIRPDLARQHLNYGVAKTQIISASPIRSNTTRLAKMRQDYGAILRNQQEQEKIRRAIEASKNPNAGEGGTAFNPDAAAGAPADPAVVEAEATKDRFLGESMMDDFEFTILVAIVIEPAAFVPPAAPDPAAPVAQDTKPPVTP